MIKIIKWIKYIYKLYMHGAGCNYFPISEYGFLDCERARKLGTPKERYNLKPPIKDF